MTGTTENELFEEVAFSSSAQSTLDAAVAAIAHCQHFLNVKSAEYATGTVTLVSFPKYGGGKGFLELGLLTSFPVGNGLEYELNDIILKGNYLVDLGYFPSRRPFSPRELEPFIPLALARIPNP
ncbi:MAG: hypothetical protein WAM97_00905 [Acidimicrobiales bacterium]